MSLVFLFLGPGAQSGRRDVGAPLKEAAKVGTPRSADFFLNEERQDARTTRTTSRMTIAGSKSGSGAYRLPSRP